MSECKNDHCSSSYENGNNFQKQEKTEKIKSAIGAKNKIEKQSIIQETRNCIKDALPGQIHGPYKIDKFIDGDTLRIIDDCGKGEKLRLLGIDTPETVHPNKPVECYGPEASQKIKELLREKRLYLEIDPNKERGDFGRLLVYIYAKGNFRESINVQLIEGGFAKEYTYKKEFYNKQEKFKNAEKQAQETNSGMWGECDTQKQQKTFDKHSCKEMNSCEEAKDYLKRGLKSLDRDKDGIPCESICK